jgi:hypothetical protein
LVCKYQDNEPLFMINDADVSYDKLL